MGISGLTTFLQQYAKTKYESTVYIRDCPIVIDGYNLVYHLYLNGKKQNSHLVGGDYVGYATRVREFFQRLNNCGITPIVIFDGAYEDIKLSTVYARFESYIKENIKDDSAKQPGHEFTPIGMKIAFIEILQEQKIIHFQTIFEADDTLALISQKLNAPLLSSDSDFFVYSNVRMSIPLNALEFRRIQLKGNSKAHALTANVVNMKHLCKDLFKFSEQQLELLPFLGIILGNDKIPKSIFQHVHHNRDTPARIKGVLKALQKSLITDPQTFMSSLLNELKIEREKIAGKEMDVRIMIKSVLDSYLGLNGEARIWNSLERNGFDQKQASVIYRNEKVIFGTSEPIDDFNMVPSTKPSIVTRLGIENIQLAQLPDWFIDLHSNCKIAGEAMELFANKRVWLTPQTELASLAPSQTPSLPIIQVAAGLLLGECTFSVVSRNGSSSFILEKSTTTTLPSYGKLPTIQDTKFRNKANAIILETFGCLEHEDFIKEWPANCRFIIITLIYFLEHRYLAFPVAIGVILSILKSSFDPKPRDGHFNESSKISELIKAQHMSINLLKMYSKLESDGVKKHDYEILRTYYYSEYKCILAHGKNLNALLGSPYKLPKITQINSYIVYHTYELIEEKYESRFDEFMKTFFKNEPIGLVFNKLHQYVFKIHVKGISGLLGITSFENEGDNPGNGDQHDGALRENEMNNGPITSDPVLDLTNKFANLDC